MAGPPTLPTAAALATDPTPSTIVQKMIGLIIIWIRETNPSPNGLSSTATSGARNPTAIPSRTAAITARYSQWVRSRRVGVGASDVVADMVADV